MKETAWNLLEGSCRCIPNLSDRSIVLWGAGRMGVNICEDIKSKTICQNIYFCDNDKRKWGKKYCGILVKSPDEVEKLSNPYVIVCVSQIYRTEINQQLDVLKLSHIGAFEYIFMSNKDHFFNVYNNLLADKKSQKSFFAMIKCRITDNFILTQSVFEENRHYAIPEFQNSVNEKSIFIDCGAFVGDSTEEYIKLNEGIFKKIYAFEPCKKQFNAMKIRVDRLKKEWALDDAQIELVQSAVGRKNETQYISISSAINGNYITESNHSSEQIDTVSLDEFFRSKNLNEFVTIKADIEGQELNMLKGSQNIIKQYRPKLAICIYHNPQDFFEIPEYIHSLVPEYKMFVRHHSYNECETILYCCL